MQQGVAAADTPARASDPGAARDGRGRPWRAGVSAVCDHGFLERRRSSPVYLLTYLAVLWIYVGFVTVVLVMLAVDLGVFHRHAHEVRMGEALGWTVVRPAAPGRDDRGGL